MSSLPVRFLQVTCAGDSVREPLDRTLYGPPTPGKSGFLVLSCQEDSVCRVRACGWSWQPRPGQGRCLQLLQTLESGELATSPAVT